MNAPFKLRLKNFKCYLDHTFELKSTEGIVLISGESGKGKSTLMQACVWAITGDTPGSLLTYGLAPSASTSVELTWRDIVITRTRRPNRLLVKCPNGEYEDDVAQEYLRHSSYFGPYFNLSGYIRQKGINNFLLMRPGEKLQVLESIAFEHIDLDRLRQKVMNMISSKTEELNGASREFSIVDVELKEAKAHLPADFITGGMKLVVPVGYPPITKPDERKRWEENLQTTISKLEREINSHAHNLQNWQTQLQNYEHFVVYENDAQQRIAEWETTLHSVESEIAECQSSLCSSREIDSIKQQILYAENADNLRNLEQKYSDACEAFRLALLPHGRASADVSEQMVSQADEIAQVKQRLKDISTIVDISNDIARLEHDLTERTDGARALDSLTNQRQKKSEEIQQYQEQEKSIIAYEKIHKCPHCKKPLQILNGEICKGEGIDFSSSSKDRLQAVRKSLALLSIQLREIDGNIFRVRTAMNKLEELQLARSQFVEVQENEEEELHAHLALLQAQESAWQLSRTVKRRLDNINSEPAIAPIYRQLLLARKAMPPKTPGKIGSPSAFHADSLKEKLNGHNEAERKLYTLQRSRNQLAEQINTENSRIDSRRVEHPGEQPTISPSTLQALDKAKKRAVVLKKYLELSSLTSHYQKWKKRHTSLSAQISTVSTELTSAKIVKQKLLQAESLAIDTLVQKLNGHLEVYLSYFFPDDPMTATFGVFRETKTKKNIKPEINMSIFYKGCEGEFDALSGGEQDRLQMCLTLALADMLNTSLILLDESVSSLNVELVQNILYNIDTSSRLILLIAHQITEGLFNESITI